MNQYRELVKRTARVGVLALIVVGIVCGVTAVVFWVSGMVAQNRAEAEGKLSIENARLADLRSQIAKSDQAEKKYEIIMDKRSNDDFSMNQEILYDWLKTAALRYRLTSLKVTRALEVETARPELVKIANHAISIRKPIKMEFQAVSDTHAFSFLEDMLKSSSGIIQIISFDLKRKSDITSEVLEGIGRGSTPLLVDVRIEFIWVGVVAKKISALNPSPATPAVAGGK